MREIFIKDLKNVNLQKLLILARQFNGIKLMTGIGSFCLTTSGQMMQLNDDRTMWQNKARRNQFLP